MDFQLAMVALRTLKTQIFGIQGYDQQAVTVGWECRVTATGRQLFGPYPSSGQHNRETKGYWGTSPPHA